MQEKIRGQVLQSHPPSSSYLPLYATIFKMNVIMKCGIICIKVDKSSSDIGYSWKVKKIGLGQNTAAYYSIWYRITRKEIRKKLEVKYIPKQDILKPGLCARVLKVFLICSSPQQKVYREVWVGKKKKMNTRIPVKFFLHKTHW